MSPNHASLNDDNWAWEETDALIEWLVDQAEAGANAATHGKFRALDALFDGGAGTRRLTKLGGRFCKAEEPLFDFNGAVIFGMKCALHGFAPAISVHRSNVNGAVETSVQVGLFFVEDGDADGSVRTYGYRFESPSPSTGGPSRHAYYHAQPIKSMRSASSFAGFMPEARAIHDQFSDGEPTIPLPINPQICPEGLAPVGLLLIAIWSVLGKSHYFRARQHLESVEVSTEVRTLLEHLSSHIA